MNTAILPSWTCGAKTKRQYQGHRENSFDQTPSLQHELTSPGVPGRVGGDSLPRRRQSSTRSFKPSQHSPAFLCRCSPSSNLAAAPSHARTRRPGVIAYCRDQLHRQRPDRTRNRHAQAARRQQVPSCPSCLRGQSLPRVRHTPIDARKPDLKPRSPPAPNPRSPTICVSLRPGSRRKAGSHRRNRVPSPAPRVRP